MGLIWRAVRGRFFTVSLLTVGSAAAATRDQWLLPYGSTLFQVFFGVLLVHAGVNLWNDFADAKNGCDWRNTSPSPYNGGSRVVQDFGVDARVLGLAAGICLAGALWLAVMLAGRAGWRVPALVVLGIGLGLSYSSPPLWLNSRGLGELAVGICFGPLLAEGTAVVMTGSFSAPAFWVSIPLGMLVAAVLTLNSIPDRPADSAVRKMTLAARWGTQHAIRLYTFLVAGAFVALLLGIVVIHSIPLATIVAAAATLPMAERARRAAYAYKRDETGFVLAAKAAVQFHFSFGLAMISAFIF